MLLRRPPNRRKRAAGTGSGGEMPRDHRAKDGADPAMGSEESSSDETVHATEPDMDVQEAELLIQKLNELGQGEAIREQECLDYFDNMASDPPWIDLRVRLEKGELANQDDRHALCRLRYYKYKLSQQASKEELHDDQLEKGILGISEDDCNTEFLMKERFFRRFDKDETFDWFFHPDYLYCSFLDDYQRLVPKNHGYSKWSEYHTYLHSYEAEREYVEYCEELSNQLKHMMKASLEYDETMKMVEEEFQTCTAAITPEDKEDKAKELIAEAVNKQVKKLKSYEQYIRKKIHIARIVGILDSEE